MADWGSGMSAGCTTGPTVCWRGQRMAAYCTTVSLALAVSETAKHSQNDDAYAALRKVITNATQKMTV